MSSLRKRKRNLWLAAFLWALLLSVFSLEPVWVLWLFLPGEIYFSLSHAAAYGVFAFLICLFLAFRKSFFFIKMNLELILGAGFLIAAFWGAVNEMIQVFVPDRNPSWGDFSADLVGAVGGLCFFILFKKFFKAWHPEHMRR